MMHYDNAHPNGINLGPTRVLPKSMGRQAGATAQIMRVQIKKTAAIRAARKKVF